MTDFEQQWYTRQTYPPMLGTWHCRISIVRTNRRMYGQKDRKKINRQQDRPGKQTHRQADSQTGKQTDRQTGSPVTMIPTDRPHASRAASTHLAMRVSQLLMQRPIAVLQLLHLPLQSLPGTLYCCQFDLGLAPRLLQLLLGLLAHLCQLSRC